MKKTIFYGLLDVKAFSVSTKKLEKHDPVQWCVCYLQKYLSKQNSVHLHKALGQNTISTSFGKGEDLNLVFNLQENKTHECSLEN